MCEIELIGGRTTANVVRIGETVRRPSGVHSAFVERVLRHLEKVGFDGVPRSLGQDRLGRDVFSFIEGRVPADLGWHDDQTLTAAANLIRRYHDATAPLLDTKAAQAVGMEVICHNDLSPCNFVFRESAPVAIIDFDAAAPGSICSDVGYALWMWLDIGNHEIGANTQRRRVRLFQEGYASGLTEEKVISAIMARQKSLAAEGKVGGHRERREWAAKCLDWTTRHLV